MKRQLQRISRSAKLPVTSPKGKTNFRDRMWEWLTYLCVAITEFFTDIGDYIDSIIINVSDSLIPTLTAQAKEATTFTVKVITFLALGYVMRSVRKKRGADAPTKDQGSPDV